MDGSGLCPVIGMLDRQEQSSTPMAPQRRTSAVKHGEKTGFYRRLLSSTTYNGALWTHAVFVWYFAVLDSSQPSNTKFGCHTQSLVHWCGFLCAYTVEWARQWPLAQHDEVQGANWQAGGDHP
jgi:hypothetical protein